MIEGVKFQSNIVNPVMTVVVPVRNLGGARLFNCLTSLKQQTLKDVELIIADYGSSSEGFKGLMAIANQFDCTVYRCETNFVWSLSIARNIGIRLALGKYVATVDADVLLEPKVLETTLETHSRRERSIIVSTVHYLPKLDLDDIKLPRDFPKFAKIGKNPGWGFGAFMSTSRSWWHKVRGFNEKMKGWGAEDDEILFRAKLDKRQKIMIQELDGFTLSKVYHQYHPKPWLVKSGQMTIQAHDKFAAANTHLYRKTYRGGIIKNDEKTWGGRDED